MGNRKRKTIWSGTTGIRIWKVDDENKKFISTEVNFGNLKRQILCICIDPYDKYVY